MLGARLVSDGRRLPLCLGHWGQNLGTPHPCLPEGQLQEHDLALTWPTGQPCWHPALPGRSPGPGDKSSGQ